jgi:hypothetical protein
MELHFYRDDGSRAGILEDVETLNPRDINKWAVEQIAIAQHPVAPGGNLPRRVSVGQDEQTAARTGEAFIGHAGIWGIRYDRATGQAGLYIDDDGGYSRQCTFDCHWVRTLINAAKDAQEYINTHLPRYKKR